MKRTETHQSNPPSPYRSDEIQTESEKKKSKKFSQKEALDFFLIGMALRDRTRDYWAPNPVNWKSPNTLRAS